MSRRPWIAVVICALGVFYCAARGPWRAVTSTNSYDFASVYGATRLWMGGHNPYDMSTVVSELRKAGDDPFTMPNAAPPPSVYLPMAFPVMSPLALLLWKPARLAWSLLSMSVFAASVFLLVRHTGATKSMQWLIAAGAFFYSPVSSGLSTGNPSVLSCSLTMIAVFLIIESHDIAGAIALGLAHCIKPQVSIAAVALLLIWRCWRPLLLSAAVAASALVLSSLKASTLVEFQSWVLSLRQALASIATAGGANDASPANPLSYQLINSATIFAVWVRDALTVNVAVWMIAAAMIVVYCWRRSGTTGSIRNRDMAFFSTVVLTIVYHRYYDAQLLLMVVPYALALQSDQKVLKIAITLCLAIFVIPAAAAIALWMPRLTVTSPLGFLAYRHQPVTILGLCLLVLWPTFDADASSEARVPSLQPAPR